jgi:uncharacterized membrane protein YagU involved in acid resistance
LRKGLSSANLHRLDHFCLSACLFSLLCAICYLLSAICYLLPAKGHKHMSLRKELFIGALGGMIGALAMTGIRTLLVETGMVSEPLPHKVERRLALRIGIADQMGAHHEDLLAQGQHLALGATFGAGYSLLRHRFDLPSTTAGPLYGLAVYAINIVGLGPALDLTRAPWDDEPPVVARQIFIHLIYGLVTAMVIRRLAEDTASLAKGGHSDRG